MGSHPINLAVRFALEIAALIAAGMWAWKLTDSWARILLALLLPIALATLWGVFAVPGDPSRSGAAPVPTSGIVRLIMELLILNFGAWCFSELGYLRLGSVMAMVIGIHYILSYDRILWLFSR